MSNIDFIDVIGFISTVVLVVSLIFGDYALGKRIEILEAEMQQCAEVNHE